MLSRRFFLAAGASAGLAACARTEPPPVVPTPSPPAAMPLLPAHYGAITDEPWPIPAVPQGVVPPHLWRQEVANPYPDQPEGALVVDPQNGLLYLIGPNDTALRYGAGTGREAFAWSGDAVVQFTREWPRWKAPDSMIVRDPSLEPYSVANGGMDPGPGNPLGARALYLFQNGRDTLYRIHGACEPEYLGKSVSAGCVRLLDHDVIDLHERVRHHAPVTVLPATTPPLVASA